MRKTQKLNKAVQILSGERFADCDVDEFFNLMRRNRITTAQIYTAVQHFGYRWTGNYWKRQFPRWLENALNERDRAIVTTLPDAYKLSVLVAARISRGG